MNWGWFVGIAAPFFVFLATLIGLLLKRASDRAAARAQAAKDKADREAKAAQEKADREADAARAKAELEERQRQELINQQQEDLAANRAELRSIQGDMAAARVEMTRQQQEMQQLWRDNAAVRRELTAAHSHIADVHRWDDEGRHGPMPAWKAV